MKLGFPFFWRHTHVVVKHNSDINPKLLFPCVQCTWVCLLKYTCYYYNVLVNHNVPHKKITRIGGLPYFQTSLGTRNCIPQSTAKAAAASTTSGAAEARDTMAKRRRVADRPPKWELKNFKTCKTWLFSFVEQILNMFV